MINNREEQLQIVLTQLIHKHFFGDQLEWNHRDGVTLFKIDKELYMQIFNLIPNTIKNK